MMKAMRIAHISDLHLSPHHKRSNIRRAKTLLEHIRHLDVDHIVITGDIVADAEKDDFRIARKLFQSAGIMDSAKTSVVIGNHDVFGGVHIPEDILGFPSRCKKTNLKDKVEEFREQFQELFRDTVFGSDRSPFPYLKPFGDVLFIGLNSVAEYSALKNPVGSNGLVDERQQHRLDRMLSSSIFKQPHRIVLIHHHFNKMDHKPKVAMHSVWNAFEQQTMKLRGKKELMKLLVKHKVNAVLHGHYHVNMEYDRKGLRFYNGGGAILGPHPSTLHLNLLHVSAGGIRVQQQEIPMTDAISRHSPLTPEIPLFSTHAAA